MEETKIETIEESCKQEKEPAKTSWLKRKMPFLFRPSSLFYFGFFAFVLGAMWTIYSLITNRFTQMFSWDYAWQYAPFAYDYYDSWHTLFRTGHFPLYDTQVWLGTDNIGSGAYYGLFDPFLFFINFFPRSAIPQTYALSTFLRLAVSALLMRSYLRYMGIKEWTARFGAIAYAFSGYTTFMAGFPSFVSATAVYPLMLLGIEKVLKERKPMALIIGVFLVGLTNFFLLVPTCIFGVFYALWRFFAGLKRRTGAENAQSMLMGICCFGIGLMLSAFTLLPSLRQTMLSGRSASIGSAYWQAIKDSLKQHDIREFFTLVFEEVGDNPGRELMGLISFFFPTGGFTILPMARSSGYDAWTASLFTYTPILIFFFAAMIHSVRLKKWSHFLVVGICVLLIFTNFSYFFFYAFSGNGYGRWFIVLVPVIVYYACWGFDQRMIGPKWINLASGAIAFVSTIVAFYVIDALLDGKTFTSSVYNPNNLSYWQSSYVTAKNVYQNVSAAWYFYYQLALIAVETFLVGFGMRKKWLPKALLGCIAFEVAIMGNATYAFNSSYSVASSWGGGESNVALTQRIVSRINAGDHDFFRTQSDSFRGMSYTQFLVGTTTSQAFHSLMNFATEDFSLANHMKNVGNSRVTYGSTNVYNPSWSGSYMNKRYATDTLLGYRYYVSRNPYPTRGNGGTPLAFQENYPFGAVEIPEYGEPGYRVYGRSKGTAPNFGFLTDPSRTYLLNKSETSSYTTDFFHNYGGSSRFLDLQRMEEAMLFGAIVDDDTKLPETFSPKRDTVSTSWSTVEKNLSSTLFCYSSSVGASHRLSANYYESPRYDASSLLPDPKEEYADEGFAYFLQHSTKAEIGVTSSTTVDLGKGKITMQPVGATYFNEDPTGAYFEIALPAHNNSKTNRYYAPAIYALGDKFDSQGNVVGTNALLALDYYAAPCMQWNGLFGWNACTFGLYARDGRVRHLVLAYDEYFPSAKTTFSPTDLFVAMRERRDVEAHMTKLAKHVQNVVVDVNTVDFDLNASEEAIFVSQLGYDAGWNAVATIEGREVKLQSIRVDGGLYGFVAPKSPDGQAYHVHMRYSTPLGNLGVLLWVAGIGAICLYFGLKFYFDVRKIKKAEDDQPSA